MAKNKAEKVLEPESAEALQIEVLVAPEGVTEIFFSPTGHRHRTGDPACDACERTYPKLSQLGWLTALAPLPPSPEE